MLAKLTKIATAMSVVAVGLLSAPAATASGTAVGTPTDYSLGGSAFGTHVVGGSVPANSGKTAFAVIGCTNQAGLNRVNAEASIPLGGVLTANGLRSRVFTVQVGDKVSSWSTHRIASVTLVDVAGIGTLSLKGISSVSHAYHDGTGFHATAAGSVVSITLTLLGIPVDIPVPPAGQSVTIPGLAEISIGKGVINETDHGATGSIDAVKLHFLPTDTTVVLGHANSRIGSNVRSALFTGNSIGAKATLAGGVVQLGKTPFLIMPCRGTGGNVKTRDVAGANLGGLGSIGALSTSEYAKKTTTHAHSWNEADVADVSLLGGTLLIHGVTGRVNASYASGGSVVTDSDGTTVLSVTFNGNPISLPPQGTVNIPGVADLSTDVEHVYPNGRSVVALRVELLGGSGATIDLGSVRTFIHPSGL